MPLRRNLFSAARVEASIAFPDNDSVSAIVSQALQRFYNAYIPNQIFTNMLFSLQSFPWFLVNSVPKKSK